MSAVNAWKRVKRAARLARLSELALASSVLDRALALPAHQLSSSLAKLTLTRAIEV